MSFGRREERVLPSAPDPLLAGRWRNGSPLAGAAASLGCRVLRTPEQRAKRSVARLEGSIRLDVEACESAHRLVRALG